MLLLSYIARLHDQNKSGVFEGPAAFIQPIREILKSFQKALFGWKKAPFALTI